MDQYPTAAERAELRDMILGYADEHPQPATPVQRLQPIHNGYIHPDDDGGAYGESLAGF